MPPQLGLTLINGFGLTIDQSEISFARTSYRRALTYLALQPNHSEKRSRLAAMLWADIEEVRALKNLRQLIYSLKRALGVAGDALMASKEHVALDGSCLASDIDQLFAELKRGTVPEILLRATRVSEQILGDLVGGGDLLSGWARITMQDIESRIREHLEVIVHDGDPLQSRRAARAMFAQDRGDEVAARMVIEAHFVEGNIGRALNVYAELWAFLDEEYGMEPALQTQELIARVKSAEAVPEKRAGAIVTSRPS